MIDFLETYLFPAQCSKLLSRKSFAAWEEFFFADFFAFFASWR